MSSTSHLHSPLPAATAAFLSSLQTYLTEEDEKRYNELFDDAVISGGLHPTAGGTTGTFTTTPCVGYVDGVRFSDSTTTITYGDGDGTYWVIADAAITGDKAPFEREGSTHFLVEKTLTPAAHPTSGGGIVWSQPVLPAGCVWLMRVDVASSAITRVEDMRPIKGATLGYSNAKHYGAIGDGNNDDTTALQAMADSVPTDGICYIPNGRYKISATVNFSTACSIIGDGATIISDGVMTDYMFNLDFRDTEPDDQRHTSLKQVGRYESFILNGNYTAKGLSVSRIYRSLFNLIDIYSCDGTALAIDRVIESTWMQISVQNCIDSAGTSNLVDFDYNAAYQTGSGDDTNVNLFIGCSFSISNHGTYVNCKTHAAKTDFSCRDITFYDCLFHGLNADQVGLEDTGVLVVNNSLKLVVLDQVQDIIFSNCTWQLGDATTGTCIELGTGVGSEAKHCQIVGGRMLEQSGTGTAINVVAVGSNTAYVGLNISNNLTVTDTAQALMSPFIESRVEVNHNRFTTASRIAALYSNSGVGDGNIASNRSPTVQFRNAVDYRMTQYVQSSAGAKGVGVPSYIWECGDADGSTNKNLVYTVNGTATTFFIEDATEPGNLGKATRSWRSISFAPLTAEPADLHQGMVVMCDQVTWDPALVGSGGPYMVVYDGTIWRQLSEKARLVTAAPTGNAAYAGQIAVDTVLLDAYVSVQAGAGASDWKIIAT